MELRIYRIITQTQVAGPGMRFCLWVQGCSRHCTGCAAPETWEHDGGYQSDTEHLYKQVMEVPDIEGITFLGGEPFEQAAALYDLAKRLKVQGLSIVTFTGFNLRELEHSTDEGIKNLLSVTDLLIDSPFEIDKFDLSRPWVGSSNQRFIFLTDRYKMGDIEHVKNKIEVRISPNGKAIVNGMGNFKDIEKLIR